MKKGAKKTDGKYLTEKKFQKFENSFEVNMANIAKSFRRVDASLERHEKVMERILDELKNMHEESKYFRASISNLNIEGSSYDRRIENLNTRVEKLESKSK